MREGTWGSQDVGLGRLLGKTNLQPQNENICECTWVPHVQSAGEFNTTTLEKQPSPVLVSITPTLLQQPLLWQIRMPRELL